MNEAIKLAIEKGGYITPFLSVNPKADIKYLIEYGYFDGQKEKIVLDPLFWQALGKALGWKHKAYRFRWIEIGATQSFASGKMDEWRFRAQDYFNLKLTGGDEEKFWKELINANRA